MKTINACGISCPEPLLMLRNAVMSEKEVEFIVDSKNALENCEAYAKKEGFFVNTTKDKERYKIHVKAT